MLQGYNPRCREGEIPVYSLWLIVTEPRASRARAIELGRRLCRKVTTLVASRGRCLNHTTTTTTMEESQRSPELGWQPHNHDDHATTQSRCNYFKIYSLSLHSTT